MRRSRTFPISLRVYRRPSIYLPLFLCLLVGSAFAAVSFPKPEGWVTDSAGLLDGATKVRLDRLLTEVEMKSDVEIAVVTLPTLGGTSIEEAAVELFRAWGIGKKGKDEGLLLLVVQKERKLRIEVGYGLEGTIPDGLAGEIIRDTITPRFRQGKFAEGIEAGVGQIVETIARQKKLDLAAPGVPRVAPSRPSRTPIGQLGIDERRLVHKATIFFVLLFILVIALIIAHERALRQRPWRRRSWGRFLGSPLGSSGGGWSGGGFGSGDSGGFGGFGGGSSGGGGASGSW